MLRWRKRLREFAQGALLGTAAACLGIALGLGFSVGLKVLSP